jgi:hypothetical protein
MQAEQNICELLASNVSSFAVKVSKAPRLFADNLSRKQPLFVS